MIEASKNRSGKWSAVYKALHWSTSLLIFLTACIGLQGNSMERGGEQDRVLDIHFSVGAIIFVLVVLRLMHRLSIRRPSYPQEHGELSRALATACHLALYLTIFMMLLSGWIMQMHMQPTLSVFGLFSIGRPIDFGNSEAARVVAWYVHTYDFWALVGLVATHVSGALWHHFFLRDDVLRNMLPEVGQAFGGPSKELKTERL